MIRAGRFDEHSVKRWFPAVRSITLEWHDTEASARLAERRAIQAERPRYNIADNPKVRRVKPAPATMPSPDHPLTDVLRVLGDSNGLQWDELAERLAARWPERWAGISYLALSARIRSLGVPSTCVKAKGRVKRGCRRADVEAAVGKTTVAQLRVAGDLALYQDGDLRPTAGGAG